MTKKKGTFSPLLWIPRMIVIDLIGVLGGLLIDAFLVKNNPDPQLGHSAPTVTIVITMFLLAVSAIVAITALIKTVINYVRSKQNPEEEDLPEEPELSKSPFRHLLAIPITFIAEYAMIWAMAFAETATYVPDPERPGFAVPIFTILAMIAMIVLSVIVIIVSIARTVKDYKNIRKYMK